jgi:nitronate monooxygenase
VTVEELKAQLSIPVIAAPMFLVSNPELVLACCASGVVGSFPAHATRTPAVLEEWLRAIAAGLEALRAAHPGRRIAPFAVNIVTHASNPRRDGDLAACLRHRVPIILSSKGPPGAATRAVQEQGGLVFHDIASRRHAAKAAKAGVDGVIVVSQGAGGHTGTVNPFALVNEVKQVWDGPTILAGCISTGRDVLAAEAMGADFAYVGTRLLATREAGAPDAQKAMIVAGSAADIFHSASIDGAPANWLTPSLLNAGIDLDVLRTTLPGAIISAQETHRRWRDIWSAGQGIGSIDAVEPAVVVLRRMADEYKAARAALRARLGDQSAATTASATPRVVPVPPTSGVSARPSA